jgi:hypothetical protein
MRTLENLFVIFFMTTIGGEALADITTPRPPGKAVSISQCARAPFWQPAKMKD